MTNDLADPLRFIIILLAGMVFLLLGILLRFARAHPSAFTEAVLPPLVLGAFGLAGVSAALVQGTVSKLGQAFNYRLPILTVSLLLLLISGLWTLVIGHSRNGPL